jgi:2-oxoisovalerate dehydrogenase E2 component (dihydrolipoyl transacylase)
MRSFVLPDLGEGLYEAEIVEWHVAEGDLVAADDPLVTVETDKAVTDLPAPWAGRLLRLHGQVGEMVPVGGPLAEYDLPAIAGLAAAASPVARPLVPVAGAPPPGPAGRTAVMPAVRALAAELAIDIATIAGTGPDGTVSARDVAAAFRTQVGFEPLAGTRRAMAEAMARSHAAVVPATVMDEARFTGDGVTVRLVLAIAAAARAEPALNAWFAADTGRRLHEAVHVGIAVDAPHGLVVPVLRDVGTRPAAVLRAEIGRLAGLVRERRVSSGDLAGATITLSNFGALGGRFATPVVTPPQVAILGAGRIRDGLLPLSLTYDHRAATGGEAARFLMAVIADLEREG